MILVIDQLDSDNKNEKKKKCSMTNSPLTHLIALNPHSSIRHNILLTSRQTLIFLIFFY